MSEGEEVSVPRALLERLLDRIDDLEAELKQYRTENERDKATIRQDVHEAIEKAEAEGKEASEPADGESAEASSGNDALTPMERILQFGEAGIMIDITASVKRAKAIAAHFGQWASKTPKGPVIKDNLKNLLQTATGEKLAWKQVYRACRALEKFTKGAIQFKKHRRHGWMLIAKSKIVTQLGQASSANEG